MKLDNEKLHHFDLSKYNKALDNVDLNDEQAFTQYIFNELKANNCTAGIGGYGEERSLYSRSTLFSDEEPRTIHLGIDVWTAAGEAVFAPLDSTVHSFANRNVHGDYGPVIILEHNIENHVFHTLYGHLSTDSLDGLTIGQEIKKGQEFARIGQYHENFHWPPHLHFQVIIDMQDMVGDYPGVCKKSESDFYLKNCVDPSEFIWIKENRSPYGSGFSFIK